MEKFYNLKNYGVFKKVVCNEEDTKFISKVLSNILGSKVEVIEFLKNEIPRYKKSNILVKTKDNKIIDIELNSIFNQTIRDRNLIYYCNVYELYSLYEDEMNDIIMINLVYNNENDLPKKDICYIMSEETGEIYSERFRIYVVNIKKYKEEWKRNENERNDKYIVALDANKEELEELSKKDKIIKEVKENLFEFNEYINNNKVKKRKQINSKSKNKKKKASIKMVKLKCTL